MDNITNQLIRIILLVIVTIGFCGCKLMPYKNDFDCPVPEGLKCKSLYEINMMRDQGMFEPNNNDQIRCNKKP